MMPFVDIDQLNFCLVQQFGDEYGWNSQSVANVNHKVAMMRVVKNGHVRDIRGSINYDVHAMESYDVIIVNCSLHDWDSIHSSEITNSLKMLQWTSELKKVYPDKMIGITPEGTAGSLDRSPIQFQALWCEVVTEIDFLLIYELEAISYYQAMTPKPVIPLYHYMPEPEDYEPALSSGEKEQSIMIGANDFIAGKNTIGSLLVYKELKTMFPDLKAKLMFAKTPHRKPIVDLLRRLNIKDVTIQKATPWFYYFKYLASSSIGLHLEQTITAGRFPLDCALAGIPCVSTNATAQQILYPYTTVDSFDSQAALAQCFKLLKDKEYYDQVSSYAQNRLANGSWSKTAIRKLFENLIHEVQKFRRPESAPLFKDPSLLALRPNPYQEKEETIVMGRGETGLVSVCVNTWNSLEKYTKPCIESILKFTLPRNRYQKYELVICDNASTDGTVEYLQELEQRLDNITVVYNKTNRGCPGGRNDMIKVARGEYLAVLDYDTEIHGYTEDGEDWINYMLKTLDNLGAEACGPLLEFEPLLNYWYLVDAIILYERSVFDKVGLYDERFSPYGYDNADFGYRMMKNGISIQPFSGYPFPVSHPGVGAEGWTTEDKLQELERLKRLFVDKWAIDSVALDRLYPGRDPNFPTGIYREGGPI